MDTITTSLALLVLVVLGGILERSTPVPVPRPLIQIGFGAIAGLVPHFRIALDPEVFFLLLVPPLLFIDGWRIPADELYADRWVIANMAFGLVVATVLAVGLFIVWLVPGLHPGLAFALAAALAPTDPIAVTSIAQRVAIPRRMMNLLQAESLLNDATGLICLRFAVIFLLTGGFSLGVASATVLWVSIAGLAIGFGVTLAVVRVKTMIVARIGEEPGAQTVISLLIPFVAYLAAEVVSASGLFAAVAAGVAMSRAEASGAALGSTRIQRSATWDSVQFIANGVVFVLLGDQLPTILARARTSATQTGHHGVWWPLMLIFAIFAAMLVVRLVWVWANVILLRRGTRPDRLPVWRLIAATGLAGSRGAITFAGILSLPLVLSYGTALAERDLVILVAMGVIVLSLIAASIGLPLLLRDGTIAIAVEASGETAARSASAVAALAEITRIVALHTGPDERTGLYEAAAARVSSQYLQRLDALGQRTAGATEVKSDASVLRELQIAAVRAERRCVFQLRRQQTIGADDARQLVRELDLLEAHYES
ncbi:MAG: Na+/H+ antiporter [bacterium]